MKSVLISIQPKWCELIANGKKAIEVRKTRPKIDGAFKCYIYCTKGKSANDILYFAEYNNGEYMGDYMANMKVIGEFVCYSIIKIGYSKDGCRLDDNVINGIVAKSCVTEKDLYHYLQGACPYVWHISDLKIYDKPKELSEFKQYNRECRYSNLGLAIPNCKYCKECQVTRPPQSWCYVESEVEQLKEELQEYKDKFADGRMVYQIGCVFAKKHKDLVLQIIETKFDFSLLCQIGKTVFLTREEAEKALKEMEGK